MMNIEKLQLHSKGSISLVRHSKTKEIFSCGYDDSIGIWSKDEEAEELAPDIQNCANNCQGVVAVHDDDIYVAECAQNVVTKNTQQAVVRYKRGDFESSDPLLTFSLEITALAVSECGQYLIAGSSDFNVKCLQLNNLGKGYNRYECEASVVHVSIDPKGAFFSVSTTDGNVHFRTIERSAAKKPLAQFRACSNFSQITSKSSRMHVVWQPNGEHVFVPAIGGVLVVDCAKWTQDRVLRQADVDYETFSTAAISPSGDYLAACTIQGSLAVWRIDDLQCIHKRTVKILPSYITSLVFNAFEKGSLIAAFSEGYLGVIKGVLNSSGFSSELSSSLTSAHTATSSTEPSSLSGLSSAAVKAMPASVKLRRIDSNGDMSRQSGDGDEEANDFVTFDDGDTNDNEVDVGVIKSQYGFNRDGEFVGGGLAAAGVRLPAVASGGAALSLRDSAPVVPAEPCTTIKHMKMPRPFVSGAILSQNNQRYLMWNTFGKIRSFMTSDESTIEVTFHDASIHPEFNIDNTAENYVYGDLNACTVALASKCSASETSSKLYVRHVVAWDDSREWFTSLSNGEEVECLCVGRDFIAVFTSFRFLRIFTAAGTQRSVISLPAPLVSMCANGLSLVTVRPTGGVVILSDEKYEHQLTADVFDVQPLSSVAPLHQRQTIPVCLGQETRLEWIAFTNAGRLVTMDSDCTVRLYVNMWAVWTPILIGAELLNQPDADHLWPIAVLERPEPKVRYIYCRGATYPPANKNLLPETVKWKLPVLEADTNKSGFEHEILVNELLQSLLRYTTTGAKSSAQELARLTNEYTRDLIKLFAQNFNSGRECRAVELAHLTQNAQGIQMMCNFAAKKERAYVSEKIAAIGRGRIQAEENAKTAAVSTTTPNIAPSCHSTAAMAAAVEAGSKGVTETNRIAPNPVRLKRKLITDNTVKSAVNPFTPKRSAATAVAGADDSDLFDDGRMLPAVPKTPMSALLNADSDLSQLSLAFQTPESEVANRARNPFKRGENANLQDVYRDGDDFFDQLSKRMSKTTDTVDEKGRKTTVKSKRQSKLSFGSSAASKENEELAHVSNGNDSQRSDKKATGFDLWSEKNRVTALDEFIGNPADFQKFLVQKFRTLDAAEKARWNQAAKSS